VGGLRTGFALHLVEAVLDTVQRVLHPTLPGTMDTKYHLRPRPTILCSLQRADLSLNVTLLPGRSLKTFIDSTLLSLLFYIFTCPFNVYRFLFIVILSRSSGCN